jgi:hypothetical protein
MGKKKTVKMEDEGADVPQQDAPQEAATWLLALEYQMMFVPRPYWGDCIGRVVETKLLVWDESLHRFTDARTARFPLVHLYFVLHNGQDKLLSFILAIACWQITTYT